MKKTKKIPLLFSLIFVLALASGCSKNVQNAEDVSTSVDEDATAEKAANYKAGKKIKNAKPYEGYVQIGDKVVQLPATYKELKKELGFELLPEEEIQSEEFLTDGRDFLTVSLSLDSNGNYIRVGLENPTEERIPLAECQVEEIIEFSPNSVFFPGGLTLGSSFEETNAALGDYFDEFDSDDSLTYYYSMLITDKAIPLFVDRSGNPIEKIPCSDYRYKIDFDRNTNTIVSMECLFEKNITKDYLKYTIDSGTDTPIYCEKPYGLGFLDGTERGRYQGILSVDDKPYLMIFSKEFADPDKGLGEIYDQYEELIHESTAATLYSDEEQRISTDEFSKRLIFPEDKKILTNTETDISGISYSTKDGCISAHLVCNMYYPDEKNNMPRDFVALLYPVEGTELSDEAVTEFKEIVEHIGSTITGQKTD